MPEHEYAMIGKYFCYIVAAACGLAFFSVLYVAILGALFWKFRRLRFLLRIVMSVVNGPAKDSDHRHLIQPLMFTTMIERDGSTWGAMD